MQAGGLKAELLHLGLLHLANFSVRKQTKRIILDI
jgi:hypothetical protein